MDIFCFENKEYITEYFNRLSPIWCRKMLRERLKMLVNQIGLFDYDKSEWLEYQNIMEIYFEEYHIFSEREKKELCLAVIGEKTLKLLRKILNPISVSDVTYQTVITKLEAHFYPIPSKKYYLTKFNFRRQKRMESFFEYVLALRNLLNELHLDISEQQEKLKNQITLGAKEELRQLFKGVHDLTLTEVFNIGLQFEIDRAHKPPRNPRNHNLRKYREATCFRCKQSLRVYHENVACPFDWAVCTYCNSEGHVSLACKYKNDQCKKCGKVGHVQKFCNIDKPVSEVANEASFSCATF